MRVMLATILINEMEWLPRLVEQHKDWPGLVGWCFVEGADPIFKQTNPEMVSEKEMSVDGTSEFLEKISKDKSNQVCYLRAGNGFDTDGMAKDQYKCWLRNLYYEFFAPRAIPDVIVVLDADEMYTRDAQEGINAEVEATLGEYDAWMFKQRHIWRPPSVKVKYISSTIVHNPVGMTAEQIMSYAKVTEHPPLFSQEVVGGYWQVPHTRVWKYIPGMRHVRNHNWPEVDGQYLNRNGRMMRCDLMPGTPECTHLGYASSFKSRSAKAEYYKARGEGSEGGSLGRKRSGYNTCREAHLRWRPGDVLPGGAKVIPYTGPVPEVLR